MLVRLLAGLLFQVAVEGIVTALEAIALMLAAQRLDPEGVRLGPYSPSSCL